MIGVYTEKIKKGSKKGKQVGEEAGGGVGEAEMKGGTSLCRKQISRGAEESMVAASGDGELVPTGKGGSLVLEQAGDIPGEEHSCWIYHTLGPSICQGPERQP